MKKILLTSCFAAMFLGINAQEAAAPDATTLQNKKGVDILPQSGEWGLGVNALPFIHFLGNTFNNTANNTTGFGFMNNNQTIYGKYFLDNQTAIRAALRIGYSSTTTSNNAVPDMGATRPNMFVEDSRTVNSGFYMLSAGIEKRKGQTRLQGIYGAEAFFGLSNQNTKYAYGNALTATTPSVFFTDNFDNGNVTQGSERLLEARSNTAYNFGIRGFIGVEYFVAPRISIGGEFGWGPSFRMQSAGRSLTERFNNNAVETIETPNGSVNRFVMDTDNLNGAINVMFYF